METLAYLHLALAYETPAQIPGTAGISLIWLGQQKRFTSKLVNMLGLAVVIGIAGMANKASAVVKQGDRGQEVTALQQRLAQLGYFNKVNVTGYFGSLTKEAIVQFQKQQGLTPDGIVGKSTQASLSDSQQPVSKSQPVNLSSDKLVLWGDRGDRVVNIQQRLAAAGFAGGEKGVFDDATEEAVRRFQEAQSLKVDGIVGPQTLAALPEMSESHAKRTSLKPRD